MRRILLLVFGIALLAVAVAWRPFWDSTSAPALAERESENGGPPPLDLQKARFGGEPTLQHRAPASPLGPSTVSAASWQALGPVNMVDLGRADPYEPSQGRVNCVAADPNNPQHLYLGSASGGVWVTTDGGTNWIPQAQQLPVLTISAIVVSQQDGNTVYVATGDADGAVTPSVGVYKSTDSGATWNPTGYTYPPTSQQYISRLAIDPTNASVVYAAASDGIYITTNGGTNWTRIRPDGGDHDTTFLSYYDVKVKPGTPSTIYAVAEGGRFFRSINSGATWQPQTTGLPDPAQASRAFIAVTQANPQLIYMACGDGGRQELNGIYVSGDGGSSFAKVTGSDAAKDLFGNAAFFDLVIAASPTNANEVYLGGIRVVRSGDGGATWASATGSQTPFFPGQTITHVDIHGFAFINGAFFACSDGGLHRTTDGGTNWTNLSPTLNIAQIYSVSGSKQRSSLVYVGEQDNGFNRFLDGKWEHAEVGDHGRVVVDPTNDQVVYTSANFAVLKTTDGGASTQGLTITTENKRFEGAPIALNPANTQVVYAGYENIHRSTDGGGAWQKISNFTDGLTVDAIVLAPSDSKTIYVARSQFGTGNLYRSTDEGGSFTDVTNGLPSAVTGIAVDPQNANRLWVSLQGGNMNAVYASTDAGASWSNFTGTTLPNSSTRCIVYENGSQDGLYVGTLNGVYYRNAMLNDWQPYNTNLPNAIVTALEIDYVGRKLRAATYGRGLWQSQLASATAQPTILANISTRLPIQTGDNALIGGFIVTGTQPKRVIIRALGPSVPVNPVSSRLADPTLELYSENTLFESNDNWKVRRNDGSSQEADIRATTIPPGNDLESAIVRTLQANGTNYTAIVRGLNNGTGIGVIEAYDLDRSVDSKLANISTRGLVQGGDNILIAGTIVLGASPVRVIVRALGPSVPVPGRLDDPTLELKDSNGTTLRANDNWRTGGQEEEIIATTIPPTNDLESALVHTLPAAGANYTAIVRGVNDSTGVAVVEIYVLQ